MIIKRFFLVLLALGLLAPAPALPQAPGVRATALASPYSSEVRAWKTQVIANGGTVSQSTLKASDTLVRALKAASIWPKIDRLNLFAGSDLAACLVPLKVGSGSAVDTNTNFVAADYTEGTGLTGNGTSKFLDTGVTLSSPATGAMGFYNLASIDASAIRRIMGSSDSSQNYAIQLNTTPSYTAFWGGTASITAVAGAMPLGVVHSDRSTSTRHDIFANGTSTGNRTVSTTPLTNSRTVYVFAWNNAGSAGSYAPARLGGYWITSTLTAGEVSTFTTIIEAFEDAIGRGVV